jgi:hypothetical protein
MTSKDLYSSIAGVTNLISVDIVEGYKTFSRTCNIVCDSTTLGLGDSVTVDLGYSDSHGTIFTGVVKKIDKTAPDGTTTLLCFDELVKASDYFMVADNPQIPFSRANIDATDLVRDLLAQASITSFSASATTFVFTAPQFNLVSVADAINQVAGIIAYHVWADESGTIHFADRRPYVMGSDSPAFTFTTGSSGNIITDDYSISTDDLRNKVVVYGLDPIVATASIASSYLPVGFYQTAVIASPLITAQAMAQSSADFNLALYNRLTTSVSCEALGNYQLHVNSIVTVTESHTGVTGNWFVYSVSHSFSESGYTMRMVLKA